MYCKIDGKGTWPVPNEKMGEIVWELRYGNPSQENRLIAASFIEAYNALVRKPPSDRAAICRALVAEAGE